jgi:hypothetical protein
VRATIASLECAYGPPGGLKSDHDKPGGKGASSSSAACAGRLSLNRRVGVTIGRDRNKSAIASDAFERIPLPVNYAPPFERFATVSMHVGGRGKLANVGNLLTVPSLPWFVLTDQVNRTAYPMKANFLILGGDVAHDSDTTGRASQKDFGIKLVGSRAIRAHRHWISPSLARRF